MTVNGIGTVALFAVVMTLGGCGCGGGEEAGLTSGLAGPVAQAPGPDRSLIGPANAPVGGSAHRGVGRRLHARPRRGADADRPPALARPRARPGPARGPPGARRRPGLGPGRAAALDPVRLRNPLRPCRGSRRSTSRRTPWRVEPGQRYAIVLRSSGGSAVWWRTSTDQAAFAHAAVRARPAPGAPWGPWQASLDTDFSFQTWMTPVAPTRSAPELFRRRPADSWMGAGHPGSA